MTMPLTVSFCDEDFPVSWLNIAILFQRFEVFIIINC